MSKFLGCLGVLVLSIVVAPLGIFGLSALGMNPRTAGSIMGPVILALLMGGGFQLFKGGKKDRPQ
jgi:hypothetical protein